MIRDHDAKEPRHEQPCRIHRDCTDGRPTFNGKHVTAKEFSDFLIEAERKENERWAVANGLDPSLPLHTYRLQCLEWMRQRNPRMARILSATVRGDK